MEDTNKEIVYVEYVQPTVKEQVTAAAVAVGFTLVITGIFAGASVMFSKIGDAIDTRRAKKDLNEASSKE